MAGDKIAVEAESIREMGRNMIDEPMRDLDELARTVARIELSAVGGYGVFGLLGSSLGDAFDEVKLAAQTYVADKRKQVADIHTKAYDTANGYVGGDTDAATIAAKMPTIPT
ncbi:hypothetical protein SAMN05444920_101706 [Nonomuraea solani]|uniref:Uncharacterized protein n=1 Tax=Nonomuraea solani TaxID=1144553 RepID=A0A1H5V0V8_9ACTN|nr:hypothetical protein [Nonomuraea solani]SEF80308.1 hypothetical protein SAMN05444920_101706 [Nonomuraea solani]